MRMADDLTIIPFKKVIRKNREVQSNNFSLSVSKRIKHLPQIKNWPDPEEEFPVDKWIMPPQPQRYLKGSDHDFL
jgi:hypothetical protein